MTLTTAISEYDSLWPEKFARASRDLLPVFGINLLAIYHVGSTAVIGLCAKPEIDILVEVFFTSNNMDWSKSLAHLGYARGNDLSVGHQFYRIDLDGLRTHKLHVCVEGHSQIQRMISFRNSLRENEYLRIEYGKLKRELEQANTNGISEYIEKKGPFIDKVVMDSSV